MSSRRGLWIALRTILSILLLSLLLWRVRLGEMGEVIKNARPPYLVLAFMCNLGVVLLSAHRWRVLLYAQRILLGFKRVVTIYFVGFFFNNFLPAGVGLDLTRAFYAARDSGKKAESLASVIVERVLGFLGLLLFALFALGSFLKDPEGARFFLIVLGGTGLLLILAYLFLKRELARRFRPLFGRIGFLNLGERVKKLYNSIYLYKDKRGASLGAVLYSVILQGLLVLDNYFVGSALGLDISPVYYFAYIPIICIISMVPISINGLGVREGSYVLFFGRAGVANSQSLSLSLIFFFIGVACSLIGGFLFPILGRRQRQKAGEDSGSAGNGARSVGSPPPTASR